MARLRIGEVNTAAGDGNVSFEDPAGSASALRKIGRFRGFGAFEEILRNHGPAGTKAMDGRRVRVAEICPHMLFGEDDVAALQTSRLKRWSAVEGCCENQGRKFGETP